MSAYVQRIYGTIKPSALRVHEVAQLLKVHGWTSIEERSHSFEFRLSGKSLQLLLAY
jgi:hypothetical protein